jgi:hypothetical protein
MPTKKPKRSVDKARSKQDGDKEASVLRVELARTEKALTKAKSRADRWKKEAKSHRKSASRALARVEKLRQKLDESHALGEGVQPAEAAEPKAVGRPMTPETTVGAVAAPDETWSVVRLRAEARSRGLTGMSNKTKAQLLHALS